MTTKIIQAKSAVIKAQLHQNVWIEIKNGIIASINEGMPPTTPDQIISETLIPGFIDMHCHGGGGKYFSSENEVEIQTVVDTHAAHGTTSMLASLITQPIPALKKQIQRLIPFVENDTIKGIHLEGPYLSHARCGAHEPSLLRDPTIAEMQQLLDVGAGHIRMITIAPELSHALDVIAFLVEQGVVVALGHSDSDFDTAKHAMDAGATVITHFYNGLPPLDHHQETITSAALLDGRVTLELILDGHHVNPPAIELMFLSAPNRIALVTDAMSAAGENDGNYMIGALEVVVNQGEARLKSNGSLAGSTLTLDKALMLL